MIWLTVMLGWTMVSASTAPAAPKAWQDPATGLAIGGFDPISYFTQRQPLRGSEAFEILWGGATWRFLNPGNQAAFQAHPEIYAPQFAGYDPYALAKGLTTRGHPAIWAIHGDRIYLFHHAANRRLWDEDRDAVNRRAAEKWLVLSRDLPSSIGQ